MAVINDINLLQAKTLVSPFVSAIEEQIRVVSYVLVGVICFVGIIVGIGHSILQVRYRNLIARKENALVEITNRADKEILYRAVKSRIQDIQGVFEKRMSLHEIVGDVAKIARPPSLKSFTVNEDKSISIKLTTTSISEAMTFVNKVVSLSEDRTIALPHLETFVIDDQGELILNIRFQSLRKQHEL